MDGIVTILTNFRFTMVAIVCLRDVLLLHASTIHNDLHFLRLLHLLHAFSETLPTCLTVVSSVSRLTVTRIIVDTIYARASILTCVINTIVDIL